MEQEKKRKLKVQRPLWYTWALLVLFSLLTAATYTWFSLSQTPSVSEMGMTIDSETGLELAFELESEDEEWTQHLDFRENAVDMDPLKPITGSESDQCFYAAEYGVDGRIAGITYKLSDEGNTNSKNANSYYMKNTCYARTGQTVNVSLSPAVVSGDGIQGAGTYVIGTPVWDGSSVMHNNGGHGAEYAIRVGIRISKYDREELLPTGETIFYIYEPNYDGHIDGSTGDVVTESINGSATLVPQDRLIRQTTSSWSEVYPVQREVVVRDLGEFTTNTELFTLEPEEMAKIDIYVWLEGQDVDCTNMIGTDAQLFMNIQFAADAGNQSGLEIIR